MEKINYDSQIDYSTLYTEASEFLGRFSKLDSKRIPNSFLDPFFLRYDSAEEIKKHLDSELSNALDKGKFNLRVVLWNMFKWPIFFQMLLRLTSLAAQFLLFYFIDNLTHTLKGYTVSSLNRDEIKRKTILNISLMISCLIIFCFCNNRLTRYTQRYENRATTILQVLLYDKLLKAKLFETNANKEKKREGTGTKEEDEEVLNLNNLITNDVKAAKKFIYSFHELWSAFISIIISLIMIESKLKSSIYLGIGIIFFLIVVNIILMHKYINNIDQMSSFKDKRTSLTSDVVQGIKSIKSLLWEQKILSKISILRTQEVRCLTSVKVIERVNGIFYDLTPNMILFFTLIWYIKEGYEIKDLNVFTIIGLVNSLVTPIGDIPWAVSNIGEANVAFERISSYLKKEEMDSNLVIQADCIGSNAVEMKKLKFTWPIKKNFQTFETNLALPSGNEKKDEKEGDYNILDNEVTENKGASNFQLFVEDLVIEKGKLYFIIGKVGCGKTAFLKSLLNELDVQPISEEFSKKFIVNGTFAYVAQNNWLQDTSIRSNILMGADFDPEWYRICIDACELLPEIDTFPSKDEYLVGAHGSNLSGGQRQRIAICRAIYSKADIYLFDDAFSSLDFHVSQRIFSKLILNLLSSLKKTVLFVTSTHGLINSNSKVILVNDFHEVVIINREGAENHFKGLKEDFNKEEEIVMAKGKSKEKPSVALGDGGVISQENNREEEREEGKISTGTIKTYISSMGYSIALFWAISILSMQIVKSLIDFWLKSRVNPGDASFSGLDSLTSDFTQTFAYFSLALILLTLLNSFSYILLCVRSAKNLFDKLMESILFSRMKFFDMSEVGSIINRISKDTNTIDLYIPLFLYFFSERLITITASLLTVVIQFPWMIIGSFPPFIIMYLNQRKYRGINREIKRLSEVNNSKLINHVTDTSYGIVTIRAFKNETFFMKDFLRNLNETNKTTCCSQLVFYWNDIRAGLCSILLFSILALSILLLVILDSEINYSDCSMALIFMLLFLLDLNLVLKYFAELEGNFISVERTRQYFDNTLEELCKVPEQSIPVNLKTEETSYSVVFDRVFLTYDQGNGNTTALKFALKNFSFAIKKGEKVAFCGRTGSGKTSILNALLKLYDIHSGDIRFEDQKSIHNLSLSDIRSRIAIIPQYGFLFRGTLRENLDPEGKFIDDDLKKIIKESEFEIQGYFLDKVRFAGDEKQDMDLDFIVENSGANLSNGEKQIINFLRILIHNKDIICLDEATSNIDPKTDHELHESIFKYVQNKTLIVITHRLEQINKYDRVFVVENGDIVEQGHASELRSKNSSFFQNLFNEN